MKLIDSIYFNCLIALQFHHLLLFIVTTHKTYVSGYIYVFKIDLFFFFFRKTCSFSRMLFQTYQLERLELVILFCVYH